MKRFGTGLLRWILAIGILSVVYTPEGLVRRLADTLCVVNCALGYHRTPHPAPPVPPLEYSPYASCAASNPS